MGKIAGLLLVLCAHAVSADELTIRANEAPVALTLEQAILSYPA